MRLGNCNPKSELRANRRQQATAGLPQLDLAIDAGNFTSPDGLAYFKQREKERLRREQAEARQAKRNGGLRLDSCELHHCAVAELNAKVPAGSVDAIITDPPYEKKALPEYANLGAFACHALKPSGVLVCMAGSLYLPQVIDALCQFDLLTYRWCAAWVTDGNTAKSFTARAWQKWKPLLVFHKKPRKREAEEWFIDKFDSRQMKDQGKHHKWGQQTDNFQKIVDAFAWPGQTIADPFLGGGTTAVCALQRGCAFVGADIDASCLQTTRKRIEEKRRAQRLVSSNGQSVS